MDVWWDEIGNGLAKLFVQPLFYWSVILLFMLSVRRIKQERSTFGTRVYDIFAEGRSTWRVSLVGGAVLSVLAIGGGIVVTYPFLLLLSLVTILLSLTLKLTWLSAAYTFGITYLLLMAVPYMPAGFLPEGWADALENTSLEGVALMMSVLFLIEGVILAKTSSRRTFPERVKGNRGKMVGQHRVKKLVLIPMVGLLPAGAIEPFAPWWPIFSIGANSYGLIFVPLLVGWEWVARAQTPKLVAMKAGRQTLIIAIVALVLSAASLYWPILSLAAVAVCLLGREMVYAFHRMHEKRQPFFTADHRGVRILGTIPGSPADKMDLLPGELIVRVNSIPVTSVEEFYEALQTNRALSKIEVKDFRGENRFTQRATYEGEHHELGILFVQESFRKQLAE
ncbi:PDZ domain-containing protein [Halobacillus naozhouensis]|uniref:PDZ domain-containing protein n=1 Tax=Halobacillus naozhouensis TaxID=554880 RepID=A0ABY8IUH4_9BACI|nr:PDZ domain-containing protein [Halobacillus naozhouensis]WFT73757.1 PDZ domain-containing protein [Halobacillus naozhouensis]